MSRFREPSYTNIKDDPCKLTSLIQYQCSPEGGKITCWPLERIFRKCGKGPAIEITNHVKKDSEGKVVGIEAGFLAHPPSGKNWNDRR